MMTRLPSPAMVVRVALAVKPRSKTASGGLKSRAMTSATVSLSKESSGVLPTPTLGGSSRASGATPGVGAELGELVHLPELGRLRPLALPDRTGLGVEERDQAIGDLFAGEALADLLYHLAAQPDHLLQLGDSSVGLAWQAETDGPRCQPGLDEQASCLAQRGFGQLRDLFGQALNLLLGLSCAPSQAAVQRRIRLLAARLRSRTRLVRPGILACTLRAARASTLTASTASPESVGWRMSASCTVESQRMARTLKPRSLTASWITSRVRSSTSSGPRRRVSLRMVDSSGTSATIEIRQKRRRWKESATCRTSRS